MEATQNSTPATEATGLAAIAAEAAFLSQWRQLPEAQRELVERVIEGMGPAPTEPAPSLISAAAPSTSTPAAADWRTELARLAGCEIGAIAAYLQRDPHKLDPDLTRGLGIRLEQLAGVVISAVDDDHADEAYLFEQLHGPEAVRQRSLARRQ